MLTSPTSTSPQALARLRSRIPLPVVAGVLLGLSTVYIWSEYEAKWVFYILAGLLFAAALPMATMLVGGPHRLFLGFFLFSLQFYLSFNLAHDDKPIPGGVQGVNISLQFLAAVAYLCAWKWMRPPDDDDPRAVNQPFVIACMTFLALAALSIFNTTTKSYTIYGLVYHFSLIVVALAACHICSSRSGISALWKAVCVILVVQSLVMLVQRATHVAFSLTGEMINSQWQERAGGTMGVAPVSLATLLEGFLLFAEMRVLRGNTRTLIVWGPVFGLGFLCLLLSLTRSAWIGYGIGTVLVLGWTVRHGGLPRSRWLALASVVVIGIAVAYAPVRDRLDENHHRAAEERWKLNFVNIEMIKAHPLVGVGLNTAYDVKNSYIPSFFTEDDWVYIAHNQFLLIAAETGIVGFAGFVWVLWIALKSAYAAARAPDPAVGETGVVILAYLLAMTWGMTLDFYGGMQVYTILWFILGCAAGLQVLVEREKQQSTREPAVVGAAA